jgi:hypothetical protein
MPCKREAVQIINMPIPPTFSVCTAAREAPSRKGTGLRMKWIQEFLEENLGLTASTTTPMSEQSGHNGRVHHREVGLDARCVI